MKGIVLAGGRGTRLSPLTNTTSKQLLPVAGRPMINYPISTLLAAGITDILIITTPEHAHYFSALLGDGNAHGARFEYAIQPSPDGIAQALVIGKEFIGQDNVALILGDNLFEDDFSATIQNFAGGAQIFAAAVPDPERFGVVAFHKSGKVDRIVEKPTTPISPYAIAGLYLYDHRACEVASQLTPSARGEYEITDVHTWYLSAEELTVSVLKGFWVDAGTHESLRRAHAWAKARPDWQLTINCLPTPEMATDYHEVFCQLCQVLDAEPNGHALT